MAIGGGNEQIPAETAIITGDGDSTLVTKMASYASAIEDNPQTVQDNLEETIDNMFNGGIVSGCVVTAASGLNVNVALGVIVNHQYQNFAAQTNYGLTDDATNYLYVKSDGTLTHNITGTRPTAVGYSFLKIAKIVTAAASVSTISQAAADIDILSLPNNTRITGGSLQIASDSFIDLTDVYGDLVIKFKPLDDNTGVNFLPDSVMVGACVYNPVAREIAGYSTSTASGDPYSIGYYTGAGTTDKVRVYFNRAYTTGSNHYVEIVIENAPAGFALLWMRAEKRY